MSSPYRLVRSLLAALLVHGWRLSYASAVLSLTPDNYAKETEGKILFLKLFAPWCGHCKAMRHDWERLSAEYEGHERYLVAEVDCTTDAEAETWCSDTFEVVSPCQTHRLPPSLIVSHLRVYPNLLRRERH
jgi:thiol-disulfide isomerase/thioredoxin